MASPVLGWSVGAAAAQLLRLEEPDLADLLVRAIGRARDATDGRELAGAALAGAASRRARKLCLVAASEVARLHDDGASAALELVDQAADGAGELSDLVNLERAAALVRLDRIEEAEGCLAAVKGPDALVLARAAELAGTIAQRRTDFSSAVTHFQLAVARYSARPGAERGVVAARIGLAGVLDRLGQNHFAERQSDLAWELLSDMTGEARCSALWKLNRVIIDRHDGQFAAALELAGELVDELAGLPAVRTLYAIAVLHLAIAMGGVRLHVEAADTARRAVELLGGCGNPDERARWLVDADLVLGELVGRQAVNLADGDPACAAAIVVHQEAMAALRDALRIEGTLAVGLPRERARTLSCLAVEEAALGDRTAALELIGDALAVMAEVAGMSHDIAAANHRYAALLAAIPGREAEAEHHFRLALIQFESLPGVESAVARCRVDWGGLILAMADRACSMTVEERRVQLRRAADLVVPGALDIDADRFTLPSPDLRLRWRDGSRRALGLAMELLYELDDREGLADLIVASRASGVLDFAGSAASEVRLCPVPTLIMPNGRQVGAGDGAVVRYI